MFVWCCMVASDSGSAIRTKNGGIEGIFFFSLIAARMCERVGD